MFRNWVLILAATAMMACHHTQPQKPRVLGEEQSDSTVVRMLEVNQHMVDEADMQLASIAEEGYVLMDENYWVKGLKDNADDTLSSSEYVSMEAQIYDLKGRLITTHQAEIQMGKVDDIRAIVSVLPKMRRGQQISMLVPWYLAFGSAGNQEVMPYENIRVELQVK